MSLDIVRIRKKLPAKNITPIQSVEKSAAKSLVKDNKNDNQPPRPAVKEKKKSANNIWWWLLFIILFLLFIGIIYFIWRDNKISADIKKSSTITTRPGIVSNFPTVTPSAPIVSDDSSSNFNINLLTERVDKFDQIVSKTINDLSISNTTSATSMAVVNSTIEINQLFRDLFAQAKELYLWLSDQIFLLENDTIEDKNIRVENKDYLDSNNDYLSRLEGELKVVEAFLELEENQNFINEILLSFKNINNYFKQIRNMTKLIESSLFKDLSENISTNTATSTVTSTTTTTSTNQ